MKWMGTVQSWMNQILSWSLQNTRHVYQQVEYNREKGLSCPPRNNKNSRCLIVNYLLHTSRDKTKRWKCIKEDLWPLDAKSIYKFCHWLWSPWDRCRRLNWHSLNKRNRDSELETFHSLILWTSTALQRQQQLLLVPLLEQLLEQPLELLLNLHNVLTFISTLATPETDARSKPGGTKQSTQM